MQAATAASEIAKLISKLSRAKSLPEGWAPNDFVSLVRAYTSLVGTINAEPPAPAGNSGNRLTAEEVDRWIQKKGLPFAYERMAGSAEKADLKRKQRKP